MSFFGPSPLKVAYEVKRWEIWFEVYKTERDRSSPDHSIRQADLVVEGFTSTFDEPADDE